MVALDKREAAVLQVIEKNERIGFNALVKALEGVMARDTVLRIVNQLQDDKVKVIDSRPGPRRSRLYGLTDSIKLSDAVWRRRVALLQEYARMVEYLLNERAIDDKTKLLTVLYYHDLFRTRTSIEWLILKRDVGSAGESERQSIFYRLIERKAFELLDRFISQLNVSIEILQETSETYYRSKEPPSEVMAFVSKRIAESQAFFKGRTAEAVKGKESMNHFARDLQGLLDRSKTLVTVELDLLDKYLDALIGLERSA